MRLPYFAGGVLHKELGEREEAIAYLERALELGLSPQMKQGAEEMLQELGKVVDSSAAVGSRFWGKKTVHTAVGVGVPACASLFCLPGAAGSYPEQYPAIEIDCPYRPRLDLGANHSIMDHGQDHRAIFFATPLTLAAETNTVGGSAREVDDMHKDELDSAIEGYTKAIALDPQDAEAYGNRGLAYYGKGDYDQAIADLSQAIALDPQDAEAYCDRGNAYRRRVTWTRPSPTLNKPSPWNRSTLKPTVTAGSPITSKATWTRPSPTTTTPLPSIRIS